LRYQQRVRDAHAEAALGYLENPLRIRSLQRICGSSRKPLSFGQPGDSQKLKRREFFQKLRHDGVSNFLHGPRSYDQCVVEDYKER
jgi:hypothetical protein